MKRIGIPAVIISLLGVRSFAQTPVPVKPPVALPAAAAQKVLQLPLTFEKQTEGSDERFVARGNGYVIGLDHGKAVIGTIARDKDGGEQRHAVSLEFAGAREDLKAVTGPPLQGRINDIRGNDPKKWHIGMPTYARVTYSDVYPGIDAVYYGNQRELEFDLMVKPGADPNVIRLKIEGAPDLSIDGAGALDLGKAAGNMKLALPQIYQEINGTKKNVSGHYSMAGRDEVAFHIDSWDRSHDLIIDPTIVFSTMLGGSGGHTYFDGIAVDSQGNIVVVGYTYDVDFPTVSPYMGYLEGYPNVTITKIDPMGPSLVYSTYLGGSGYDQPQGVALDSTGAAWVIGATSSYNFPLVNATSSTLGSEYNTFVSRLDSNGNLTFSTVVGATGSSNNGTLGYGVAVDSQNNAYVTGANYSTGFPTTAGVMDNTTGEAFVVKFNESGVVQYSTLLGGANTWGYGIAVDSSFNAYVTGATQDTTFTGLPKGGAQPTNKGGGDGFVAKLNAAATALDYFTFFGGTQYDSGYKIAVDSSGNAYFAGITESTGLATSNAAQKTFGGYVDGFAAKLNAAGSAFTYVTYIGGARLDYIEGVALDGSGNVYLTGYTDSDNFPLSNAIQSSIPGQGPSLYHTIDSAAQWSAFDTSIDGAVYTISVNPTGASALVYTESGIYRTTDNGSSWTLVFDANPSQGTVLLARSPVSSGTVFASYYYSQYNYTYLYESTNDGQTWNYLGGGGVGQPIGMLADPKTATTLYAWTNSSPYVYVSTNSGETWTSAATGLPGIQVYSMVSTTDGAIYAGTLSGIYKSTNHGTSWTAVNTGLPASPQVYYVDQMSASGTTLYVALGGYIYKSTNDGAGWSPVGTLTNAAFVAASPANASVVYVMLANGSVVVSTNGGTTFGTAGTGLPATLLPTQSDFLIADPSSSAKAYVIAPTNTSAFALKLNNTGSAFLWSTYLGGTSTSYGYAVATNGEGDAFVAGYTSGQGFPVTSSVFQSYISGAGFVTEISDATAECSISVSPSTAVASQLGQTLYFNVVAPTACAWTAQSNESWAQILGGASGSGSGVITVSVAAPTGLATSNTANITVGSQTVTITQPGSSCNYATDQSNYILPATGGSLNVILTATAGCPWTVTTYSTSAVSVVSSASGTGSAVIQLSVAANAASPNVLTYTVYVGNISFTITVASTSSPLTLLTSAVPGGAVGTYYATQLNAAGGTPPYQNWTVSSGALPAGLALNASTGLISGFPTTNSASPYTFSVTVQDNASNTSQAVSLTIGVEPQTSYPAQGEILNAPRNTSTQLLLPFVTNELGFDTDITIANTTSDNVGSTNQSGTCALSFYGTGAPVTEPVTMPGGSLATGVSTSFLLSSVAPGFQGYVFVNCAFPLARGTADLIYNSGQANSVSIDEAAQVVTVPRTVPSSQSFLIPFVTNQAGYDSHISVANTSSDPFGTAPASGSCTMNFYGNGAPANQPVNVPGGTLASGALSVFTLSSVAPGFQGYVIISCPFGAASVFSFTAFQLDSLSGFGYSGTVETLALPRSSVSQPVLFPSVTNQNGYDTSIILANTSSDPFAASGATPASGICSLSFYGDRAPASPYVTPNIASGTVFATSLSVIAPGFSGYVIASCSFAQARGFSSSKTYYNTVNVTSSPALVEATPRNPDSTTQILLPAVQNTGGADALITIANTTADPFGTTAASGTCTLTYFGTNAPTAQTTPTINSGTSYSFLLSAAATGFAGYIEADCGFPLARATAQTLLTPPPVSITTTSLPAGTIGTSYGLCFGILSCASLAAINGTPPYQNWTVASGSLPPGLTLNASTGAITGTPTTDTGSPFSFTVTVQDNNGNTSAAQSLSISIGTDTQCTNTTQITGTIKWNGTAVAGAIADLESTPYFTNSPLATATAGSTGAFAITNPPAGSYTLFAVSPSSTYLQAEGYPVTVTAGCTTNAGTLNLYKALTLVSPANNSSISTTTPALKWTAFAGSTSYNVQVVNITPIVPVTVFNQSTKTATITVSPALTQGDTYQWTVTASDANGNIAQATATFTVFENQTITFNPLTAQVLGTPPPPLSASATSLLTVDFASTTTSVCTVSGVNITLKAGGTCTIKATQPGDAMWAAAPAVTQSFTVLKTQTIDFQQPGNATLGSGVVTLSASSNSGLAVKFASNSTGICSVSGVKVTLLAQGTCSITASQAGNSAYAAATPVTLTFQVLDAQTITFLPLPNVALNASLSPLSATATSNLTVVFTSNTQTFCTVSGANLTLLAPGTCSITATQPGDGVTYAAAPPVTQKFTVLKTQTITFGALSNRTLSSTPFTVSATATSGLTVKFSSTTTGVCTVTGTSVKMLTTGTCTVEADQAGNSVYAPAPSVTQSFTVTAATD